MNEDSRYEQMEWEFLLFHAKHPEVYRHICNFTDEMIQRGFTQYTIGGVTERVRWHTATPGGSPFKISNNHRAFYARLWMREHPEHPNFFVVHQQTSKQSNNT